MVPTADPTIVSNSLVSAPAIDTAPAEQHCVLQPGGAEAVVAMATGAAAGSSDTATRRWRLPPLAPASQADPFASTPSGDFGPLTVHAEGLERAFTLRRTFSLAGGRVQAAAGARYDLAAHTLRPSASLLARAGSGGRAGRIRFELSERVAALRQSWELPLPGLKGAAIGVSAEARVALSAFAGAGASSSVSNTAVAAAAPFGAADMVGGGASRGGVLGLGSSSSGGGCGPFLPRPGLHVGVDYVKPWKYELAGIALLLALNLPMQFSDKVVELPLPCGLGRRLRGVVRASVRRTGYARASVALGEASGVMELRG
jgi:hypothetical protein